MHFHLSTNLVNQTIDWRFCVFSALCKPLTGRAADSFVRSPVYQELARLRLPVAGSVVKSCVLVLVYSVQLSFGLDQLLCSRRHERFVNVESVRGSML